MAFTRETSEAAAASVATFVMCQRPRLVAYSVAPSKAILVGWQSTCASCPRCRYRPFRWVHLKDARRLVAGNVEISCVVERKTVRQAGKVRGVIGAAGRTAVRPYRDTAHLAIECLDDEQSRIVMSHCHAIGEVHRLGPPEVARACGEVVTPYARALLAGAELSET